MTRSQAFRQLSALANALETVSDQDAVIALCDRLVANVIGTTESAPVVRNLKAGVSWT